MKRTLALILTVMMVLCMIPASLLSVLANGPGVGKTDPPNLSLQAGNGTYIPETVQVDGILDDTGWDANGWFEVNTASGTWSVGTPRNNNFEYEYQLHRNETFFYGAYSINLDSIYDGALDEITVWINDGSVSDKATQKIVISNIDAAAGTADMTAYDKNGSVVVDPDMTNSSVASGETPGKKGDYYTVSDATKIAVKATTVDKVKMVVIEFRVNMDNFDRENDFRTTEKLTAFSQVKLSGSPAESLYYPRLATTKDSIMAESPDAVWPENAHVVTQSDIRNDDGKADYNNVLPTDINIDGRFTEGGWVNLTDRYTSKNYDGIGYSIDDYRRSENYDNGYVTDISDVEYSGTVANGGADVITNGAARNDPSKLLTLPNDALRFKFQAGLNRVDAGGYLFTGGVVTFADGIEWKNKNLYCYVMIQNGSGVPQGLLEIIFDGVKGSNGDQVQYTTYYYNKTDLAKGIGNKTKDEESTYGGAHRQTYSRYLVNFEFRIALSGSGLVPSGSALPTDWTYLIEVSDKRFKTGTAVSSFGNIRQYSDSRANSGWWDAFPSKVTRHYNDSVANGDLAKDTWQHLNAADPYIDGASGYQSSGTDAWKYIRQDTHYYYEVYADYDYLYGAAIIHDKDGWVSSTNKKTADTFTLWVYNNTVVDQQCYNFAISFYNTSDSKNTFDETKTGWDVSAWYKNAASNSLLKDANPNAANVYTKGDAAMGGIEAVMRKLDNTVSSDIYYGTKTGDDNYYAGEGDCMLLEFKIPVSLLFYDQAAGADAFSPAIAFGYYTSVSAGGVNALTATTGGNLGSATIAHPMGNNHGAGLDRLYKDNGANPLYNYSVGTTDLVNPIQTHYYPDGTYWIGPSVSGKTKSQYYYGDTSYEVNDRVFDPRRIYAETCRQIRSDDSNDGWRFGRVIDNFKLEGRLEEVYWNEEEELIAVNGETGYWDNLPSGNTDFNYGYRVYTGREYVYGAVKVNAVSIKDSENIDGLTGDARKEAIARNNALIAENNKIIENTKITVWFNADEGNSTNATHRFTFWVVDSYVKKCEAVNLVTGLDIPLAGTVLEEGFATSGTKEEYVLYEVKTVNNDIVVEFMIDLDMLNLNSSKIGEKDYARDGYEYVVGVSHPVEDETLSLYHLEDEKTFWVTGYADQTYGDGVGMIITEIADINVGTDSDLIVFAPTAYENVYKITKRFNAGERQGKSLSAILNGNGVSIADGGFVYVFNSGAASGTTGDITTSYAGGRGNANVDADLTVGAYIKIEGLSLVNDGSYTKNEATYTYCGYGNFDPNDKSYPYHILDGNPNPNNKNAHLDHYDSGYISAPQYSVFTPDTSIMVADDYFSGAFGNASPALEVSYLEDYITDKIYVDGLLNDQGWQTAEWTTVIETVNGNRQTINHTSGKQNPDGSYQNEFQTYEYAVRTDDEYFYVAGRIYMPIDGIYSDGTQMLDKSGAPVYPTWRLWINNDLENGRNSFTKLYDLEGGSKYGNTLTFEFLDSEIDSRTNYYRPEVISNAYGTITSPASYKNIAGQTVQDATVTVNNGTISLKYNNYHVRVSDNLFPLNPNGGSSDPHYTLAEGAAAGKMTQDQGYRESSFYGETVIIEENAYAGNDYDDISDDAAWVAERHLKNIIYGSEHATMREDPENHNVTLVEYKIKLSELVNEDGVFEYGFHCSALGSGDSGNDYLFFYPMVTKEVAQDISKYDRFHMPMWFWSDTCLVYNEEFAADIMMKSTYAPVTEIGADAYTLEDGDIFDAYYSYEYGAYTSAVRLGAYYDHDYISRFIRDQGIENYTEWDYWDTYEMGVLIYPSYMMKDTDENGNTVLIDHDDFLNVTAEDRYYKLSKGVKNVEADLIENHLGGGSRYCDYENFVFYAAMVLSPAQAQNKAYNNLKYSYRGYVDFYGNDLYNDEFEGWPTEMDPFLQYYYSNDALYEEGTFVDGVRNDIYVNTNADANNADGLSHGGNGLDINKSVENSEAQKTIKLPNLEKLDLEKYGLTSVPDVTDVSAVPLGKCYSDPADGSFTLKRFSLAEFAKYGDFYSDSMIRSVEVVREIASRKGITANTGANRVENDGASVYYVAANNDPISKERVEYLAASAGYSLDGDTSAVRGVVYVDGTNVTVADATNLANTMNLVATTTDANIATSLKAAGIATVYNSDADTLGMLGMAALVSKVYGNISVDVDYFGKSSDISADKAIINQMLTSVGVKNTNVANSLNILVLSTDDGKGSGDYNNNLLAKLADNLAANVPTVVIDMTGKNGLTYNDSTITPITETMHLARLLGYSSMPVETEAAAIAIAQGVARYAYLTGVTAVEADTNIAFLRSLTYSLVNDIAFVTKYVPDATENASGAVTGIVTAPKTQAFQFEAEKIVNQLNGSGILVWIDAKDGNESENADACVLVGNLVGSENSNKVLWGDEAVFEILITSGVNVARQNYSVGKTGATITKTAGNYANWTYTEQVIVNPNNTQQAATPTVNTTTAKNNSTTVLVDGETTTKVWDFLLPDALTYTSNMNWTATAPSNTVPGIDNTNLYLSNAQVVGRLNVARGFATEGRWVAVGNGGSLTISLSEAHSDLSAIRVHLGSSADAKIRKPGLFFQYSTSASGTDWVSYGNKESSGSYNANGGRIYTIEAYENYNANTGLSNYSYWAILDLSALQGTGVKRIKLTFAGDDARVAVVDEIEIYTAPTTKKTEEFLQVGTFNVGHCENINSGEGTAFGMYYTSGGNAAGGTIKWANYSNANTTVADVQNVGKFIKNSAGVGYDVMFIQEAAQYFGSNGGSHIWGNCNQMKILSEYSGYEYYTYARGAKSNTNMHGAEALITDDTTTMLDDPSVGVGVLSKYPVVASGSYLQQNGQVIAWARILVGGQYIDVFSTHFDSNQYRTFDKYMMRHDLYQGIKRVSENSDAFIIGGDFNEVYVHTFEVIGEETWTPVLDMRVYVDYQGEPWYALSGSKEYVEYTQIAALKDNVNEYYMGVKKTANASGETNTVVYNKLYTLSRHRKIVDNIMFGGDFASQGYEVLATDYSSGENIGATNGIKAKTYEPTTVDYDPSTSGSQVFGNTDHTMLCYSFRTKVPA